MFNCHDFFALHICRIHATIFFRSVNDFDAYIWCGGWESFPEKIMFFYEIYAILHLSGIILQYLCRWRCEHLVLLLDWIVNWTDLNVPVKQQRSEPRSLNICRKLLQIISLWLLASVIMVQCAREATWGRETVRGRRSWLGGPPLWLAWHWLHPYIHPSIHPMD